MKTFTETCWEVYESFDRDCKTIAYVSSESVAEKMLLMPDGTRNPFLGKNCKVFNIAIFDTMEEIKQNSIAALRKSALAKLTPQEISALGLKND